MRYGSFKKFDNSRVEDPAIEHNLWWLQAPIFICKNYSNSLDSCK